VTTAAWTSLGIEADTGAAAMPRHTITKAAMRSSLNDRFAVA
jgi:hypothetical protein